MTASAERAYAKILSDRRPRTIRSERHYNKVMGEVDELAIRGEACSPAEQEYFRVLCALVSDYERSIGADRWPKLEPVEMLRELMDLMRVSQADVARVVGDRALVSSILSGRRQISKAVAKKLAALFRVDAGFFI
jgi:HTH-type transcriptional regulator / antitoxin HigA